MTSQLGAYQGKLSHPVIIGGHSRSDRGEIMVLLCHVILQDQVIKALNDVMVWSPSRQFTTPPSLMATDSVIVEI